jgi:hypothetical protein
MDPLSGCRAFEAFCLQEIYYKLMENHLDPEDTKSLSLTCQPLCFRWQTAPPDIWQSICQRMFTQIPVPLNQKDYKGYYYANSSGGYLLKHSWKLDRQIALDGWERFRKKITGFCLDKERGILFSASGTTLMLWNIYTKKHICNWFNLCEITCLTINRNTLFIGSKKARIRSWDIEFRCNQQYSDGSAPSDYFLKGHTASITCLSKARNEKIVSGSEDKTLRVWDLCNFKRPICLLTIPTEGCATHVEMTNDKIIGMIVKEKDVRFLKIWNLKSGDHLRTLEVARKCTTFAYDMGNILLGDMGKVLYSIDALMHPDCGPVPEPINKESDSDTDEECSMICTCVHLTGQLAISIGNFVEETVCIVKIHPFYDSCRVTKCIETYERLVMVCSSETMLFGADDEGQIHCWEIPPQ